MKSAYLIMFTILLSTTLVACSDNRFSSSDPALASKSDTDDVTLVDEVLDDDVIDEDESEEIDEHACGRDGSKVLVCHVPSGNPDNEHTICISAAALKAHEGRHGVDGEHDYLGQCKSEKKHGGGCNDKEENDGEETDDPTETELTGAAS